MPGCRIEGLPIGPSEAHVYSCVDGVFSEEELAVVVGMELDELQFVLSRLADLGAILFESLPAEENEVQRPAQRAPRSIRPPKGPAPRHASGSGTRAERQSNRPARQVKPASVAKPDDLTDAQRERIIAMYAKLDGLDDYALLGVTADADRKEVDRAYLAAAPEFHPDRFYGKSLGTYGPMLNAIFGRFSAARDTLRSRARREDYDSYLARQRKNQQIERLLSMPPPKPSTRPRRVSTAKMQAQRGRDAVASSPAAPARPQSIKPRSNRGAATKTAPAVAPAPSIPMDDAARRAMLARRLGGGTDIRTRPSLPQPREPSAHPPPMRKATAAVVDRAPAKVPVKPAAPAPADTEAQLRRYIELAQQAEASNDPTVAANAYRLALAVSPDDPKLFAAYQVQAKAAAKILADGYVKQGDDEVELGRLREAAWSYAQAAGERRNDQSIDRRLARVLLDAPGDLHRLIELAKHAVKLAPKWNATRIALIELYEREGLRLAAVQEIEAAKRAGIDDPRFEKWLERLARANRSARGGDD